MPLAVFSRGGKCTLGAALLTSLTTAFFTSLPAFLTSLPVFFTSLGPFLKKALTRDPFCREHRITLSDLARVSVRCQLTRTRGQIVPVRLVNAIVSVGIVRVFYRLYRLIMLAGILARKYIGPDKRVHT